MMTIEPIGALFGVLSLMACSAVCGYLWGALVHTREVDDEPEPEPTQPETRPTDIAAYKLEARPLFRLDREPPDVPMPASITKRDGALVLSFADWASAHTGLLEPKQPNNN